MFDLAKLLDVKLAFSGLARNNFGGVAHMGASHT